MIRLRGLVCFAIVSLSIAVSAQAAYLTTWSALPTVSDPNDVGILSGQDIYTGAWHEVDGTDAYFRIDLESAPASGNFAGVYGIWIDTGPGGAPAGHEYIPGNPGGVVDVILDLHYQYDQGGFFQADYHVWNGSSFVFSTLDAYQTTENGGLTLEFKQDLDGATIVNWCAATYDIGSAAATYDTVGTCVPEPSTILLLVMGLVGLVLSRCGRRG